MAGPYRDSAQPQASVLAAPRRRRAAALLGALATTTIATALALGSPELWLFGGFGGLVALLEALRAGQSRAAHRGLVRFLGCDAVRLEADAVRSLDGSRRVRAAPHGLRFELLTEDGRRTLASYRVVDPPAETHHDALPLEVRFAQLYGRSLRPVCFDGPPPDLGGEVRRRDGRWLRVSRFARGVLLERLDAEGAVLGDTWHPDLEAAREQVALEYGPHAGPLERRPPRWGERPRVWL